MNAFSTGTSITTVIYPETMTLLIGLIDWKLDRFGNKVYAWHNARVRPAASDMPERLASMPEMAKIAAFLDYNKREKPATKQLRNCVYLAAILLKQERLYSALLLTA